MSAIIAWLDGILRALLAYPSQGVQLVLDYLFQVINWAVVKLLLLFPAGVREWLGTDPIEALLPWINYWDSYIPIYDCLGIWAATLGVCAIIRGIRWLKSVVPIPTAGG